MMGHIILVEHDLFEVGIAHGVHHGVKVEAVTTSLDHEDGDGIAGEDEDETTGKADDM